MFPDAIRQPTVLSERPMKVVLAIPPPSQRLFTDKTLVAAMPHIGVCSIAARLAEAGHEVSLFDLALPGVDQDSFWGQIAAAEVQALLLTATTVQVNTAGQLAKKAKRIRPDLLTVLGGPHATALPERTLREQPALDMVVVGEGEETALDLLDGASAKNGSPPPGAFARVDGRIVSGGERPLIEDLDALPFPRFVDLPLDAYARFFTREKVRKLPVHTSRGCPFRCLFCLRTLGDRVRLRSAESVLAEIERDVDEFGAGKIIFTDENLAFPTERLMELCAGLSRRKKKVGWFCETHVTTLTEQTTKAMKQAGCEHVSVGIESGDPEILAQSGKGITVEKVKQAVRAAQAAGLFIQTNFILGHPQENEEKARNTIKLARELDADRSSFAIMVPFPGTQVYRLARRGEAGLRLLTENWDLYGKIFGQALELTALPRYRLVQLQIKGYRINAKSFRHLLRQGYLPDLRTMVTFGLVYLWSWYDRFRHLLLGPRKAVIETE